MGGFILLIVLITAATVQSLSGGYAAVSSPNVYLTPIATNTPVPPTAPLASIASDIIPSTIINAGTSNAGTLSPYSVEPNSLTPNPYAEGYTAPGYRPTYGQSQAGSDTGSVMALVTPYPLVTVTAPDYAPNYVYSTADTNPLVIATNPTTVPSPTDTQICCVCSGEVYNCDSRKSLTCYYFCMEQGYGDVHRLDGDCDGEPCENYDWPIVPSDQVVLCRPPTIPTTLLTTNPTSIPTSIPTGALTTIPTSIPTSVLTSIPTTIPTSIPTTIITSVPTSRPTTNPTTVPIPLTSRPTTLPLPYPKP